MHIVVKVIRTSFKRIQNQNGADTTYCRKGPGETIDRYIETHECRVVSAGI